MCSLHADGDWKAARTKHYRIARATKRTEAQIAQAELVMAKFGMQLEG